MSNNRGENLCQSHQNRRHAHADKPVAEPKTSYGNWKGDCYSNRTTHKIKSKNKGSRQKRSKTISRNRIKPFGESRCQHPSTDQRPQKIKPPPPLESVQDDSFHTITPLPMPRRDLPR